MDLYEGVGLRGAPCCFLPPVLCACPLCACIHMFIVCIMIVSHSLYGICGLSLNFSAFRAMITPFAGCRLAAHARRLHHCGVRIAASWPCYRIASFRLCILSNIPVLLRWAGVCWSVLCALWYACPFHLSGLNACLLWHVFAPPYQVPGSCAWSYFLLPVFVFLCLLLCILLVCLLACRTCAHHVSGSFHCLLSSRTCIICDNAV